MKGSEKVHEPAEVIITEHFLNIFDYQRFFSKEHLLTSLETLAFISRKIGWEMKF